MTFVDVNAAYVYLRDALRAHVGLKSMADMNIQPPAGCDDEASFLRLTAWCYTLLFEAGRVSVPFFLSLTVVGESADRHRHVIVRQNVRALRTLVFHNLGFDEHDLVMRQESSQWFMRTCGALYPVGVDHWSRCFQALCQEVCEVLRHCSDALNYIAASPTDRQSAIDDLQRRVSRDWEAYRFDEIVGDAATRIGEKINAKPFREPRIRAWREFLECLPEDADLIAQMTRRIDGEVYEHFRSSLPISTRDIMDHLGLSPGPEVKRALGIARQAFESGVREPIALLQSVRAQMADA